MREVFIAVLQVSAALDKLATRGRFLNLPCEHLTAEYMRSEQHRKMLRK